MCFFLLPLTLTLTEISAFSMTRNSIRKEKPLLEIHRVEHSKQLSFGSTPKTRVSEDGVMKNLIERSQPRKPINQTA
uniref:Secreted protein n=1 Tax=Megaselia scalaris TaxID=36166 RepID=T1H4H4_MEGSC